MSEPIRVDSSNAGEAAKAVAARRQECGPSTVRRSLTVAKLAEAMAKAQADMPNPPKDSVNPHFKSRYADLATVRDTVTPHLTKHGLAVIQLPCELDDHPALTTILTHTSGEWVETTIRLRPGKLDPQGVGSALTYARRYALQSVCGVAAEDDDDGNQGSQPARQPDARPAPAGDNTAYRHLCGLLDGARDEPAITAAGEEMVRHKHALSQQQWDDLITRGATARKRVKAAPQTA
jgi:hypothetical protein